MRVDGKIQYIRSESGIIAESLLDIYHNSAKLMA